MFPALDLPAFTRRTIMPSVDIGAVEADSPGFTNQRIATQTSWIYSRLRKRYAKTIPLGQLAPALIPSGVNPPAVFLVGRPTMGAYLIRINITTAGSLGAAQFQWTSNGGGNWTTGVITAPNALLDTTGMTAVFPPGSYDVGHLYSAATPVPECVLDWLTVLVTLDLYYKRGVNPQDPALVSLTERRTQVLAEVKEAADGNEGLFDLPTSDDEQSAVSSGGPTGYTETSPYVSQSIRARTGRSEDARGRGTQS